MKIHFIPFLSLLLLTTNAWAQPRPVSEYNKYPIGSDNKAAELSWTTIGNDVVITISAVAGSVDPSATRFRDQVSTAKHGNGMCNEGLSKFKVNVNTDATTYFEKDFTSGTVYTLKLKDGVEPPAIGTQIKFSGTVEYQTEGSNDCWPNVTMSYSYGYKIATLEQPTNVAISSNKEITFDAVTDATSYKVFVYWQGELFHEQVVTNGGVINYHPSRTGTYEVYVQAYGEDDAFSPCSDAFDWDLLAELAYLPQSEWCTRLYETSAKESEDVNVTWTTDAQGTITVVLSPVDGNEQTFETTFRGADPMSIDNLKIGESHEDADTYFSASYSGAVLKYTLIDPAVKPDEGTTLYYDGRVTYKTGTHYNAWPDMQFTYVYGANCLGYNDHVNPVVSAFSVVDKDLNEVTFHVAATDEDDFGESHDIASYEITSADNDFVTEVVTPDGDGNFTVTDLQYNSTYTFTIRAIDAFGNVGTADVEVTLPFNTDLDLAFKKSCIAGYSNGADTPDRAVNGESNHWGTYGISDYSLNWWRVDLGADYDITDIKITFEATRAYRIETSLDDSNWTTLLDNQPAASSAEHTGLTASARYVRLTAITNGSIGIRSFRVYASGFSVADAIAPVVSVTEISKTITSVTLQINASDKKDDDSDGVINAINISGDNGFVTQNNVTLDGSNQITLSGLKDNTTYTFTIHVFDMAGNETTADIEVVLPFNTNLNLALNKPCTGGYCQFSDHTPEGDALEYPKANDGKTNTSYSAYEAPSTDDAWWQVNLGATYDIRAINVNWNTNYSTGYAIYGSFDGTNWRWIGQDAATSSGEKTTNLSASAQYVKIHSYNKANIVIREVEVYGTAFSVADATDPVVTVTEISKTVNSVTLQINATDKKDDDSNGAINTINISGDNDFVTQNHITLDGSNQITLSDLKDNTTYTFTIHAIDMAGNEGTADIEVALPFNTNFNIAKGKSAVAGKTQDDNVANKGCDGSNSTMWSSFTGSNQSKEWWYVDLEALYTIRQVNIKWYNDYSKHFLIQGVRTLPDEEDIEDDSQWTTFLDYSYTSNPGTTLQEHEVAGKMRYLRLKSLLNEQENGMEFYELEVYASGYAEIDDDAPVIGTAECSTETETATATLTLTASDAVDGTIRDFYISCENPVLPETKYTTDGNNQIAVTGLDVDKDYTLIVRCRDLSGNWAQTSVIAHFSMADGTNVALGKTATAGRSQGTHTPDKAVDNNLSSRWGCYPNTDGVTTSWWKVDLTNAYKISSIVIKWQHFPDNGGIIIEGSLDDDTYSEILTYTEASFSEGADQEIELTGEIAQTPFRYVRIKAGNQAKYMSFYDFAVYASEENPFVTIGDNVDNTSVLTAHDGENTILTLNRSFVADGGNYTLVLPFDMTAEQCEVAFHAGYKLWYLSDSRIKENGDIYLNFVSANSIVAGRPYLFCPAETVNTGTVITNARISATPAPSVTAQASFIGTYDVISKETINATANAYLLGSDNWLFAAQYSNYALKALRAYFTLNFNPVNGVAPRIRVVYNENGSGVSTDIDETSDRLSPNTKFIRNGQLIIRHNGVLYNAQGAIVK